MLAQEVAVDGEWEAKDKTDNGVLDQVQRRRHRRLLADALRQIAQTLRNATPEQQGRNAQTVQPAPELQPITAFEILVGQLPLFGCQQIDIGRRGAVHIERRTRARGLGNLQASGQVALDRRSGEHWAGAAEHGNEHE